MRNKLLSLLFVLTLVATLPLIAGAGDPGIVETVDNAVEAPGIAPSGPASWSMPEVVLWDNGPLVTHPGGGFGGADLSMLQTNLGLNTYGVGHQYLYGYRIADDFVVDVEWNVDQITFFAYQTGSPTDPSTFLSYNLAVWDGLPGGGGSIIWGDYGTNCMIDTGWMGAYRAVDYDPMASNRPIMANVCETPGLVLPPGQYWLDWQADGSLSSGPWAPPISIVGEITTGDGLQSLDQGVSWAYVVDTGTGTQQGFPFIIEGTVGGGGTIHVDWIDGFFVLDYMGRPILRAHVWVADDGGGMMADVLVDASIWVPDGGPYMRSRYTKPGGAASFHWGSWTYGTWTLCVDDLTLAGYTYEPGDNVVTCVDWYY